MNWISVKERLPNPGVRVLATNGIAVGEGYWAVDGWKRYYGVGWQVAFDPSVTHWKPMPEPPPSGPLNRWVRSLPPLGAGDVQSHCPKCGKTHDVETPYCPYCGEYLKEE